VKKSPGASLIMRKDTNVIPITIGII